MKILNVEVKVHNERERNLVNMINDMIDRSHRYLDGNVFGDETIETVRIVLRECDNLFLALYYMDLVEKPHLFDELREEFGILI